jgi:hypothetical protein
MKNKNYHAVKIVLKSNRKIIETSNIDITSTHIHDRSIPSTHIHDRSYCMLDTDTSIKHGGV